MGKRFAPNYANLFMAEWEKQALRKLMNIYRVFLDILNSHQNCIKLTSVTSKQSIDFVDTTIFKGKRFNSNGHLDSKFYFKPTDTHQLLYKDSFLPNIPSLVYSSRNYYDFTGHATINQTLRKPFKYFSIVWCN